MKKYGLRTATALVIANMIGVGVFTSLGFQLEGISDYASLLLLWVVGGAIALIGSLCYGELSAAFPGSGGEYHFLQVSFGKFIGFLSGAVSATVGFSAPIAAAAFTFSAYLGDVVPLPFSPSVTGCLLVILITLVHISKKEIGSGFQVFFTSGKVLLLLALIVVGLLVRFHGTDALQGTYLINTSTTKELLSGNFWVSLIYVSYAYSGWNASAYIIDEVEDARRNVPRSILTGTLLVMILYTAIHFVFLISAPADVLRGRQDVAYVSAYHLLGPGAASVIAGLIAFFLISTISSMVLVGPRIIQRISRDQEALRFFSVFNRHDVPVRAILLQTFIAVLILLTSQFEWIITSIGFVLLLFNTLTVAALFYLRYKFPQAERSIRVPLYPVLPALFILFNLWIMFYLARHRTEEVIHGLLILAGCALFYGVLKWRKSSGAVAPTLLALLLTGSFVSCRNSSSDSSSTGVSASTMLRKQPIALHPFIKDTLLERKAAILTGKDTSSLSQKELSFSRNIRKEWQSTRQRVLQPVETWAYDEIPGTLIRNALVFYPFSGPDFAFVNAIYPGTSVYVLAGLEPVGSFSDAHDTSHSATREHLRELNRILYYSNRFGFFRTRDMARQLKKIGVFNILLFYIANSGYDIGAMRLLSWDPARCDTTASEHALPNVCYIEFRHPKSGNVSKLFYFAKDLSDRSLKKDTCWLSWIGNKASGKSLVSLTKSASYLMHSRQFSTVRGFVVENSLLHVQDDTGIPFRFLSNSDRVNTLYGSYERPIRLFSSRYQSDLRMAYDSMQVRPLPFLIGYTAVNGKCNIQLSLKK